MSWIWSPTPQSLRRNKAYVRLGNTPLRAVLLGLYLAADRWGRGDADERMLRRDLCAADEDGDVLPLVRELESRGLVMLYEADGELYWWIPDWDDWAPRDKVRDRPPSEFPDPPGYTSVVSEPRKRSGVSKARAERAKRAPVSRPGATRAQPGRNPGRAWRYTGRCDSRRR